MQLPPFGAILAQLSHHNNDIYLFVGTHAWKKAKRFQIHRPGTLCLPPYHCPFQYQWPVKDYDILIFDTGYCDQSYIEGLAICLFSYSANIVRYISLNGLLTIYKKEF